MEKMAQMELTRLTRRALLRGCITAGGAVVATSLLGACAPSAPTASVPPAAGSTSAPAAAKAAATTGPAAGSGATTVTYWTSLDPADPGPRSKAQTQIISNFMAANPDIKVDVVAMNYAKINPGLIQGVPASTGPDVVKVFQPWMTQVVKAQTLSPLNDLVAKWPKEQQEDFLFPLSTTTFDGSTYALLHEARCDIFWYRKDLLDKAGLTLPKTWDEVGTVAGKLTTDRLIGYGISASTQGGAASIAEWFHPLLWGAGAELFDKDGKAIVNSAGGVKAIQWVRDLVAKYKGAPQSVANMTTDAQLDGVKSGTIAMATDQSGRLSSARAGEGIGTNLATATIPSFEAGKPGPTGASGQTLAIGRFSKNKEAAWRFIEFYLKPESQLIDVKTSATLPSRKSPYNDAFFKAEGAEMKTWADYMVTSGRMPILPETYQRLLELEATAIQKVILSNADPKQALDEAVQTYNGELKG